MLDSFPKEATAATCLSKLIRFLELSYSLAINPRQGGLRLMPGIDR